MAMPMLLLEKNMVKRSPRDRRSRRYDSSMLRVSQGLDSIVWLMMFAMSLIAAATIAII